MEEAPTTIEAVRGQVEGVGREGIKVARRWWAVSPTMPVDLPEVGALVVLEVQDGVVIRLTCLASPDPEGCSPTS